MKTRLLSIAFLSLFVLASCHGQHGKGGHGNGHGSHADKSEQINSDKAKVDTVAKFPSVAYKKVHVEIIPFAVEKVFPLFEPQGRSLLYENWKPTILREGENGSLKGQMIYSKYDELDVVLTVREYNPEEGHIQYLAVWDDFEIQRIDIFCKPADKKNTTEVTWIEHNAGLYKKGDYLVTMFVNEGHLSNAVERYAKNITEKLQNELN